MSLCVQDSSPPESQSQFKFLELNPTCLSTGQDYSKEKSYFALWLPQRETLRDTTELCSSIPQTHIKTCGTTLRRKLDGCSDTTTDPGFKKTLMEQKQQTTCAFFNIVIFFVVFVHRHSYVKTTRDSQKIWCIYHFFFWWPYIRILGLNLYSMPLWFAHSRLKSTYPQRIQLTVHDIVSIKERQPLCEYVAVVCLRVAG